MLDRINDRKSHSDDVSIEEDVADDTLMDIDDAFSEDDDDDDELRDIPDEFTESVCTGISDIIVTGEVRICR